LKNAYLFTQLWQAQQSLEKKVLERTRQLTQTLEELQKISKRKTDFIWSVTHELRTPLTSIKGYASILLSGKLGYLPEEASRRIERINQHTDSLIELVNSLLDIAQIEAGKVTMRTEVCLLKDLIQKTLDFLALQIKEKNLEVTVDVNVQEKVLVDPHQIERVFINLLSNAVKFTPQEGKIRIQTKNYDQNTLQVDVSDTGCGIPPEAQELIFEEFYRVDNPINQQVKGTGLGLSLVKQIIQAHNGKIWVKSKLGEGSTFSFTLPKVD
ncbi:MAG: HAMP domain-containing histidine kinase, partial [Candidatus Omnitrophica bacterium]|nr:HAMP domain-containing histidine kinase [Candidatus Omnitrophota bacterium]